jgi:hypothetical protein
MICPHCGEDTDKVYVPESAWFQEFWVLFPRKVARKAAEKAWKKAATSEKVKDAIMAGLKAQLTEMMKTLRRDRGMVPHASTWLNGRRWEDEQPAGPARIEPKCAKCGDTGVVILRATLTECDMWRCSCPRGQLPGLMVGTFSLETGELISNETPQDGVI